MFGVKGGGLREKGEEGRANVYMVRCRVDDVSGKEV